ICHEFLRRLRTATDGMEDKAAIMLIESPAGKYSVVNHRHYAVTNGGMVMHGLTRPLNSEIVKIAPRGHVDCIAFGWVASLII
ncbi:uncharacterized protein EDB91DRAFT_1060400, partial [Suillus paluster]|uniref:uncharacterized protein n=1 Tax=Suillus paluster TaxID=48578 RepID=UPI001B87AF16